MQELFHASTEGIDFQHKSALALDLKIALQKLRDKKRVKTRDLKTMKLDDIVKKHTNMDISFAVMSGVNACIMPPSISQNNPMTSAYKQAFTLMYSQDKDGKRHIRKEGLIDGTVNLETGKVSGDFTKFPGKMMIGEPLLWASSDFTVEETVAIILHEIGHMFVYFEMLGRMTRTNFIIQEATQQCLDADTREQRIRILEEVEEALDVTIEDMEELCAKKRAPDFYRTTFLAYSVQESINQTGKNLYDVRSWEVLADQFATRHGYGRPLATGLDKLMRKFGDKAYRNPTWHFIVTLVTALVEIWFIVAGGIAIPLLIRILMANMHLKEVYDKPKERVEKIKQQLIAALKDRDLDKEIREQHIRDLELVRQLQDEAKDRYEVEEYVAKYIFPHTRKQHKISLNQAELERLVNNRLFEAAAQLS